MDTTTAETAAPADVDAAISELDQQGSKLAGQLERVRRTINGRGAYMAAGPLAELEVQASELHQQLQDVSDAAGELEAIRSARGGWTRAFIVAGGHVHQSTSCSSCYPSTTYAWLTELSGMAEDAIVTLAGDRACTYCYPSAPVNAPASRLQHPDEVAAAARRQQLDARKLELADKRAAAAIGPYRTADGERITTVHAAKGWLTDAAWWRQARGHDHVSYSPADQQALAELLAGKLETTAAGELEAAATRARKRK